MGKIIGYAFLALLIIYVMGFLATGGDLAIYRFWAPQQENAKREVFVQTQSYVQGKIEYLTQLQLQYEQADGDQKKTIRTVILRESSTVDNSKLPDDLQLFIQQVRSEQ